MRTYLECIPCFFKHALRSAQVAGASKSKQRRILNELGDMVKTLPLSSSPPELARLVNQVVNKVTGKEDIYKLIKRNSISCALEMYDLLKKRIARADDSLLEAVEYAIAGNVIDYGVHDTAWIEKELKQIMKTEKNRIKNENKKLFNYTAFKQRLKKAENILYLGDNAGETVFDRLLIETIQSGDFGHKNITYVVKERPAINDALMEDAYESGLGEIATIISSGSDAPGTVLPLCTKSFRKQFKYADMIISKGQGNFEALSHTQREIFFLLMIKCPVIAHDVAVKIGGASVGDAVLLYHEPLS